MVEFFAGVNTEKGFVNYLSHYLRPKNYVYIIKGTAGGGKSTLMKRIGEHYSALGEDVTYIRCSSDPSSLDGVLLNTRSIAIADGTAPHVLEPEYTAAREKIIDLGRYTDVKKLDKEAVITYTKKKKECYSRACGYLRAAAECEKAVFAADEEKEALDISRDIFFKKVYTGEQGSSRAGVVSAFTAEGVVGLNPFPKRDGKTRVSPAVVSRLCEMAHIFGEEHIFCPHPTRYGELEGVYFPKKNIYFVAEKAKTPTLARTAYTKARECLSEMRACHGLLEGVYGAATDFSGAEEQFSVLKNEIGE